LLSRCGFLLGEDSLPTIERADHRRHYGETRIRAIGVVGNLTLHCVYTQRGDARRIISLRYAGRNGMPIARRTRADIDKARLLAELATRTRPAMRPETPPDMRPGATGLRKLACEAGLFERP
jgi:hypothetical protein